MVSAMLAGVIWVLVGTIGKYGFANSAYWDLLYLKWIFIGVLTVYLVMPTLLANIIGIIFGSKSAASGNKPNNKNKVHYR